MSCRIYSFSGPRGVRYARRGPIASPNFDRQVDHLRPTEPTINRITPNRINQNDLDGTPVKARAEPDPLPAVPDVSSPEPELVVAAVAVVAVVVEGAVVGAS
jgi:hypothetical protein